MRGILAAMRRAASAIVLLLAISCAHLVVYEQQELDTLYFGTQKPDGGVVSDAEWQQFVAEVITPRFPDGLTTWDAVGQYRDSKGVIEHERTHIVQLVHPQSGDIEGRVAAIIAAYRKQFAQEAVLRVRSDVWMPR